MIFYPIGEGVTAFSTERDDILPFPVVQAHQVHGDAIAVVSDPATSREDLEGIDALITSVPGLAVGARTADCIPVLLNDPVNRVVAAVHSGWKGTVLRIAAKCIREMNERFGTDPSRLKAVIGPGIGPDSFQIGPEVADRFMEAGFPARIISDRGNKVPGTMEGGLHADLWTANRIILEESGVRDIFISSTDTYTDCRFFSARREGTSCGRIINAIMIE